MVEVTKADREAAFALLHPLARSAGVEHWLETGERPIDADLVYDALDGWASMSARARAEGYAQCQADVVVMLTAMVEETIRADFGAGKKLASAVSRINNDMHVGAATREKGGQRA